MKDDTDNSEDDPQNEWLRIAKESYDNSTTYVNANYRKGWEDDLKAFQSVHTADSKYHSDLYKYRSKLYRPKARASIRKNEAAAASAYFSSQDIVNVAPINQADQKQVLSAQIMQYLLEYRLDKSIPWFQTVMGAIQDAQTVGVVCSYQSWKYREQKKSTPHPLAGSLGQDGETIPDRMESTKVIEDRPCVELIPVENLRIDPAADWIDPINTSPYVIWLIPMYVCDIKSLMDADDPKTGMPKFKRLDAGDLVSGVRNSYDSTRYARNDKREDATEVVKAVKDYSIGWVHLNIVRRKGRDWVYYTLGTEHLLTDPKHLEKVYLHGKRPFVMGCCIIEAHKVYPSGINRLGKDLFKESNEIVNQRLDNVKLVLNKRYFIKRGQQVDLNALMRNVPGGAILMNNPDTDVREVETPDVTRSSYMEQDRINADIDDLLGNFSGGSVQTNRKMNETVKGMGMISASANQLTEYLLRTFTETWVKPVLMQLVHLEQAYETDTVLLSIAADKVKLLQHYGTDQVTDELLNQELTLTVNVGIGATDPNAKLQKLISGLSAYAQISAQPPANLNLAEVGKEIFGFLGYQDGQRFLTGEDPRVKQLMQQVQQLQMQLQSNQQDNKTKMQVAGMKKDTDEKKLALEHEAMLRDNIHKKDDHHIQLLLARAAKIDRKKLPNEPGTAR